MADIKQTLSEWAEKVITIWEERMSQLGVNNASAHAGSFVHHIISQSNGDVARIEFAFAYFLKFTDMGVGKGVTLQNRDSVVTRRTQKMWFSKTFLLEVRKLANIMAAQYGFQGTLLIKENIDDNSIKR